MAPVRRIYLDHNATAPCRAAAREAMDGALALGGNASSIHAEGRAARAVIERARDEIAALAGTETGTVIFTSGGTEANNLALTPGLRRAGRDGRLEHLFVSAVEHVSVLAGHRFAAEKVHLVPVSGAGLVDPDALRAQIEATGARDNFLVSVMLANNETGTVQPIGEIADAVHEFGGFVQCDAVQAAGKMALEFDALGVDLMSLSAHKIGGPQGVGALVAGGEMVIEDRLVSGGGQEGGYRGGTENVPGIAGFAAAARAAAGELAAMDEVARLRDRLEAGIARIAAGTEFIGSATARLANTSCFCPAAGTSESLVIAFDLEGIAVSSGAACSSGKVAPSHVLKAMGVESEVAGRAVRVSLGSETSDKDIERFLEVWSDIWSRIGIRASAA